MRIDRYVSERRHKQKKRRTYVWAVLLFLILYFIALGIFVFVVRSPAFQAGTITIEGNSAVATDQIMGLLQASIVRKGELLRSPDDAEKALLGFRSLFIWPRVLPTSTVAVIPQLAGISIAKNYFLHTIDVTVTERQPFGVWCFAADEAGGNCYWFDATGDVFARTLDVEGSAIPVIHDADPSRQKIFLNEKVLPDEFVGNFISILRVLEKSGIRVSDITLQNLSLQEINVAASGGPTLYFSLRFPADEDLAVLDKLMGQPGFDKLQYVDFTVENRAYYK